MKSCVFTTKIQTDTGFSEDLGGKQKELYLLSHSLQLTSGGKQPAARTHCFYLKIFSGTREHPGLMTKPRHSE